MKVFPEGLCDFLNYKVDDENWWDGNELVRVDLSNNQLEEINGDLATQVTLHTLNFQLNKLKGLPEKLFTLENLKILDVSNNCIEALPEAIG